jgi:ArsR family transcriptional regulator, virulence genes transcriptional regulator
LKNGKNIMAKLKFELSQKQLDTTISAMQGMAHPVRFMMLYALLKEELSVSDLAQFTGVSQSVTSQHLSKLKDVGLLDSRKESNKVFYYVKDNRYREIIKMVVKLYGEPEKSSRK